MEPGMVSASVADLVYAIFLGPNETRTRPLLIIWRWDEFERRKACAKQEIEQKRKVVLVAPSLESCRTT
jgi:hypothetical protein